MKLRGLKPVVSGASLNPAPLFPPPLYDGVVDGISPTAVTSPPRPRSGRGIQRGFNKAVVWKTVTEDLPILEKALVS